LEVEATFSVCVDGIALDGYCGAAQHLYAISVIIEEETVQLIVAYNYASEHVRSSGYSLHVVNQYSSPLTIGGISRVAALYVPEDLITKVDMESPKDHI
jgi:hypothetical protein